MKLRSLDFDMLTETWPLPYKFLFFTQVAVIKFFEIFFH
jgi:hypothetical protein